MHLFGLTGGIGSGKSVIAQGLRDMGYNVYDTDAAARRIMTENLCVRTQIELLFGSDIYTDGALDRKRVAEAVFKNPTLLERLNRIVHPAVEFDLREWCRVTSQVINPRSTFKFVESAILFESGLGKLCDAVICVTAPEEVRITRTMQRDGVTRQQVTERMANQLPDIEREHRSHLVINNDGNTEIATLCLQIQEFCCTFAD